MFCSKPELTGVPAPRNVVAKTFTVVWPPLQYLYEPWWTAEANRMTSLKAGGAIYIYRIHIRTHTNSTLFGNLFVKRNHVTRSPCVLEVTSFGRSYKFCTSM